MTMVRMADPAHVTVPAAAAPGGAGPSGEAPGGEALRRALRAYLGDHRLGADMRGALAAFCTALRARGLGGQHVVLALRDVWTSLPEARALGGAEADTLRSRLVTAAIETFYAPLSAADDGASPPPR